MKPLRLLGFFIVITAVLIAAFTLVNNKNEISDKHFEVVLRDLGHQLLLNSKDSTSRVLPIKQINENSFQISFQNEVGFVADSLINLFYQTVKKNGPATDYIVNLKSCKQNETVLAFEVSNKKGDIIPCRGRVLEVGCYIIEVNLLKKKQSNHSLWLLLLIPLGLAGFYLKNKFRKKEEQEENQEQEPITENSNYIPLGKFKFYVENNALEIDNKTITLSENETKALKIFAENMQQIVERELLMKVIWEDQGLVVISRNVDVLVSKLRKKLSDDSSLKFINVHGRGYKLIIE
jgi:DNA-binding winged helix-turn-helix (wHTH) protein